MSEESRTTVTTARPHAYRVGDVVGISSTVCAPARRMTLRQRWHRSWHEFLVEEAASATTFTLVCRRLTLLEWLRRLFK